MRCGVSTACFYPQQTLDSLKMLADAGVVVTEVFLNTFSELEDGYIARLADVAAQNGMDVVSLHPFSSAMEGFLFASEYAGRFADGVQMYRRFFEAAQHLGAGRVVFHGDHAYNMERFAMPRYAERFRQLSAVAREYGVALCHENVSYCRLAQPAAVQELRPLLGADAAFVLDTKQAVRAGTTVWEMLRAMGKDVRHVHISDHSKQGNCLPPGQGEEDFAALIAALRAGGYRGDLIIELYEDNFGGMDDLAGALAYVQRLL